MNFPCFSVQDKTCLGVLFIFLIIFFRLNAVNLDLQPHGITNAKVYPAGSASRNRLLRNFYIPSNVHVYFSSVGVHLVATKRYKFPKERETNVPAYKDDDRPGV